MSEYGFIASQENNVEEVSSKLLRYDSRRTSFNIYMEGVPTMPTPTKIYDDGFDKRYQSVKNIAHGLGTTPTFLAYFEYQGKTYLADDIAGTGTGSSAITVFMEAIADGTNLVLKITYSGSSSMAAPSAPSAYYYIFSDSASSSVALTPIGDNTPKYGLRVAKDGYDIDDGYIQHYQFLFPPMKVSSTGTQSVTANSGSSNTYTIPHGLPYRPAFRCRIISPNNSQSYRLPFTITDGPFARAWVDDTNLYIRFGLGPFWPGPITTSAKYTIYAERSK